MTPADGDQNRAVELIAVTWVGCSLSLLFVSLRIFCRARLTRNLWWDDWCICFTMILTLAFSIVFTAYATSGDARHAYYLSTSEKVRATRLNWISQSMCVPAIAAGKISVACLIIRFSETSRWRRIFLYMISTLVFVTGVLLVMSFIAQCRPTSAIWSSEAGKCWDRKSLNIFYVVSGSFFAIVDLTLAILPATIIWNLKLTRQKKLNLIFLLGMGVFAAACAAIKTSYIPLLTTKSDFTWITVTLLIWNANEINVIIIAACIPTLRPLFDKTKRNTHESRHAGSVLSIVEASPSNHPTALSTQLTRGASVVSGIAKYHWPTTTNTSSGTGKTPQCIESNLDMCDIPVSPRSIPIAEELAMASEDSRGIVVVDDNVYRVDMAAASIPKDAGHLV